MELDRAEHLPRTDGSAPNIDAAARSLLGSLLAASRRAQPLPPARTGPHAALDAAKSCSISSGPARPGPARFRERIMWALLGACGRSGPE